jgi:hypothetical protein
MDRRYRTHPFRGQLGNPSSGESSKARMKNKKKLQKWPPFVWTVNAVAFICTIPGAEMIIVDPAVRVGAAGPVDPSYDWGYCIRRWVARIG